MFVLSLRGERGERRGLGERETEEQQKMGKVVERKKRKKGRPSLLDLQKRNLKEQQEQEEQEQEQKQKHHHQTKRINTSTGISNPNYASPTPLRRSTRRNPNPDALTPDEVADDHEDAEYNDQLTANRRERKLKLVVRLHSPKSPVNSSSLNSCRSDSNADVDGNAASINKKRKIDTIGEGSRIQHSEKVLPFWVFLIRCLFWGLSYWFSTSFLAVK